MNDTGPEQEPQAITDRAIAAAREAFGRDWQESRRAIAPGRIELLGNHLDYNGGPVLCAAIDRHVAVVLGPGPTDGPDIRAVAADNRSLGVVAFAAASVRDWRNPQRLPATDAYLRGIVAGTLARPTLSLNSPVAMAIAGDVPLGFGLSSSAALCVALGLALVTPRPGDDDLVLLAQEAEHRAGTPCGTMDQSASIAGGVIRFEGSTRRSTPLAPDLGDQVFVVIDSGVQRSLGVSAYRRRVEEAASALALANRLLGLNLRHLAELSPAALESLSAGRQRLPDPLLARARHVIRETERVNAGEQALSRNDWAAFGQLMTTSGRSSATDYAISHPQVEELVAELLGLEGVLGARMMGGGEGGAVLALLPRAQVPKLETMLQHGFFRRHGMTDRSGLVHVCTIGPGARVVEQNTER